MPAYTAALIAVGVALEYPLGRAEERFYAMESLFCLRVWHFYRHLYGRRVICLSAVARHERDISGKALGRSRTNRLFDVVFMACLAMWAVVHLDLWGNAARLWAAVTRPTPVAWFLLFCSHCCRSLWALLAKVEEAGGFCFYPARVLGTGAVGRLQGSADQLALYFAQTVALARGLNLPLGASDIITSIVLVDRLFLPLSVAGLGTREGGLALIIFQSGA